MAKRVTKLFGALMASAAMLPQALCAQTASTAGPYTLPYTELWNDQTVISTNAWTVEDKNNDGITWTFENSPGSSILYSGSAQMQDADDWLVSPYLSLTAGNNVKISTGAFRVSSNQKVSVWVGTGDDPTTYTEVVPTVTVNAAYGFNNATPIEGNFVPQTTGNYRVAIHVTSNTRGTLILLPVRVSEEAAELVRPAAVADLSVEVGAKGALSSKIKFTAPTQDAAGNALDKLTRVQIYRDNTPDAIKTYEAPAPGEAIEWQDESVQTGEHTYSVVATANDLRSDEASQTVYVGVDSPLPPQNIKIHDNLDGTAKLTWDPVTENSGAHGGYVDVSSHDYCVYILSYGYLQAAGDNCEGLQDPEYTVNGISYDGAQGAIQYALYTYTQCPADTAAQSEAGRIAFMVGKAHPIPYYESFPNKSLQKGPWVIDATQSGRFGLSEMAQDGDNGALEFNPTKEATRACIQGPKIDIASAANPQLVLWYYAYPGTDGKIELVINRNGQSEHVAGTVNYSELTGDEGWRSVSFDLKPYTNAGTDNGYIRPYIYGEGVSTTILLDNIKVYDAVDNNLEATITAPAHVQNGKVCAVTVTVSNLGLKKASGYNVNLYVDGKKYETQEGVDIEPNTQETYEFAFTPNLNVSQFTVQAEAEWADDAMQDNNVTEEKVVDVVTSTLPRIKDLAASMEGDGAVLTWSSMQVDGAVIRDNFETYTPWAVSGVGDWTLYDNDKAKTNSFGGIEYPHQGEAGSFIVFNPWQTTGLSGTDLDRFASIFGAHSGNQFMMSTGTTIDTGTPTSDWLISPELSGEEQTVNFWAFAPNDEVTSGAQYPNAGPETFDVYYSEDDKNVNSFIKLNSTSYEATCYWTKFWVDLPEGAKYFAIVHTSTGELSSYGYEPNRLGIDDVKYQAGGLRVMGYNVYRDGVLVKRLDGKTTTWTDANASDDNGTHYYNVITVYANGESAASNTAGVGDWTGVNGIAADSNVNANAPVYNIAGQRVANSLKDVKGGLYIQNGKKVVVK